MGTPVFNRMLAARNQDVVLVREALHKPLSFPELHWERSEWMWSTQRPEIYAYFRQHWWKMSNVKKRAKASKGVLFIIRTTFRRRGCENIYEAALGNATKHLRQHKVDFETVDFAGMKQ